MLGRCFRSAPTKPSLTKRPCCDRGGSAGVLAIGGSVDKLGAMTAPDLKHLEAKLIEHLEAAQSITDELGLDQTGYLVERALDDARAVHWPHLDPSKRFANRQRIVDGQRL